MKTRSHGGDSNVLSLPISTPRTELKPLTKSDWDLYRRLSSEPQIIALCFDPPTEDEMRQKFESRLPVWTPQSEHWLCLVIYEKQSARPIGITGFVLQDGIAEVGYLLLPEFYGQQFGTESLTGVIEWAFEQHKISQFSATVTEGNIGSERVLEKCGFKLIETIPEAYEIGEKRYADKLYSLQK
ncbi:GNAT family N-acetyltransferase [Vibrio jasicida]|uniref:GNAT family N-acetyltransferase n=1 Tax=Vibrio jasicida TaxID=766224 RepID=UPI000CE43191|nr:GNAT family N-acetyltransferase [Vibrio jasicida]NOJ19392.1 GNAT family N-acetyltransferase [Vibrio jasicida]